MALANLVITDVIVLPVECLYKPQENARALPLNALAAIQTGSHDAELPVLTRIHSEENVNGIIAVLKTSNPATGSPVCALVTRLVEQPRLLSPTETRRRCPGPRGSTASCVLSTSTVTVKPSTIIAPYKSMHENICNLARDEAASLIIIPLWENARG